MSFGHVQGKESVSATGTVTNTFVTTPVTGNLICVAFHAGSANTLMTLQDGNGVNFNLSSKSPFLDATTSRKLWLAYLIVPLVPSKIVTATFSAATSVDMWTEEFSVNGLIPTFDVDATAFSISSVTTVNTPSINPTQPASLCYSIAAVGGNVSAPTAGGSLGGWTGAAGGISAIGNMAEYVLNQTGAISVDYTQSSGNYDCMAMSFYLRNASSSWLTVNNANSLRGLKH